MVKNPVAVAFIIAGSLTFGTLMGVATWLVAAAMGRSGVPPCRAPMTDSCANSEVWLTRTVGRKMMPGADRGGRDI